MRRRRRRKRRRGRRTKNRENGQVAVGDKEQSLI
jgi:hypothetical protein